MGKIREYIRSRKTEYIKAFMNAFPHTMPVLAGFFCLGIAYGFIMQTKGYGPLWSLLFSAVAFCGSMQYVAITLLTTAFHPLHAFLLSIMVNARHLFYGISMLEKYKGFGIKKGLLAFMLCDETFSISCSVSPSDQVNPKYFYFWISFLNYLYWVTASFLGGLIGKYLTFNTKGLDFVLTALFVLLFLTQWEKKANRIPGLIGVACTVISLLIFGRNNLVIPAMGMILFVLITGRKKICS